MCALCTESIMDTLFKAKEELIEHNKNLHEKTDEEFENLSETNLECLRKSYPDTPKKKQNENHQDYYIGPSDRRDIQRIYLILSLKY